MLYRHYYACPVTITLRYFMRVALRRVYGRYARGSAARAAAGRAFYTV